MASKQVFGPSAPSVEYVKYRGQSIETRGLKLGSQLIELVGKFPSVIGMLDTSKQDGSATLADDAITAIIAMGTGVYGDDEEAKAQMGYIADMSAGERAAFIASIIRQTAPTGIGPFVELLLSLGAQAVAVEEGGPIKMRSKKSSELPPNLSLRDSVAAA